MIEQLMTVDEVAERLRISRSTVYYLINAKQLETVLVGKRLRIEPSALQAMLDRGRGVKSAGGAHLR